MFPITIERFTDTSTNTKKCIKTSLFQYVAWHFIKDISKMLQALKTLMPFPYSCCISAFPISITWYFNVYLETDQNTKLLLLSAEQDNVPTTLPRVILSCSKWSGLKYSEPRIWHWRSSIKAWSFSSSRTYFQSAPLCDARPLLTPPSGPSAADMDWSLCLCVFLVVGLALLALQVKLRTPACGIQELPCLPALPLIGSLLSLQSPNPPHVLFKDLQRKYGQTYSLMMGSHCVVVVNHHSHAKEVLLKKGKIFAGRPRTVSIPLLLSLIIKCHSCLVPGASLFCVHWRWPQMFWPEMGKTSPLETTVLPGDSTGK